MSVSNSFELRRRFGSMALLAAIATSTFGCTPDLASIDDTYVPQSVDETYPIKLAERPITLTLAARSSGFRAEDKFLIANFGRQAASRGSPTIAISYPSGSRLAKEAANQTAGLLSREGIARQSIVLSPQQGRNDAVTMSFTAKVAETKPCGDWSKNMRSDQFNGAAPNFGCAFQQNVAAMVANPEQLEQSHPTAAATSAAQRPALDKYSAGTWQQPTTDTGIASTQ